MIKVHTPSRLHFGLLAYDPQAMRQFGGVGLMVQRPNLVLHVEPADRFVAEGPMADRAVTFARRFAHRCGQTINGASIDILHAPSPHTGLGTGTQLAMAIAHALALMIDRDDWGPADLARMVDRGQRSAIGTYGFFTGGLIVEGGKSEPQQLSPMLLHHPFPTNWHLLLVCPRLLQGISGRREQDMFVQMPPISQADTARMCQLVMLGLLPAMLENNVDHFGDALYDLQQVVGQSFATAQGGVYAHDMLGNIVHFIRDQGVRGVGQSSWGPTLYAVTDDHDQAQQLADHIRHRFCLQSTEVFVTQADNHGAVIQHLAATTPSPST